MALADGVFPVLDLFSALIQLIAPALETLFKASDLLAAGQGFFFSDLDDLGKVIARSPEPVLEPRMPYEIQGVFANCVFSNGLIAEDDGRLTVYYGAADRICAAAVSTVGEMVAAARG